MKKKSAHFFLFLLLIFLLLSCSEKSNEKISNLSLKINYPIDGTIYPRNFRSPIFIWEPTTKIAPDWKITVKTSTETFIFKSKKNYWHIPFKKWEKIRDSSINKKIVTHISGKTINGVSFKGEVTFSISPKNVEGSIFYREVPVPHEFAISHIHLVRYNLISLENNEPPRTIIQPSDDKVYACLTCHSFSNDAKRLVMTSRHPNDSLIIVNIDSKINFPKFEDVLTTSKIQALAVADAISKGIKPSPASHTDSRISPDGKYILTVINARHVNYFANHLIGVPFSINLVESNLGIYSIKEKRMHHLPGADKRGHIYSTPTWSPDGKHITYAYAKLPPEALDIPHGHRGDYPELDPQKHYFRPEGLEFDLFTIPFNNGRGGNPRAIKATQNNGLFDYFPEYSPNGKWIVYTSSKFGTNIFLNPDSTLYIVSTDNDSASKKLSYNFKGVMNSWHRFSLDGNWLLFNARPDGTNTQTFLTHIDENGNDSPPILIDGLTKSNLYRTNIPTFTNMNPETIIKLPPHGFTRGYKIPFFSRCKICHLFNPYHD